MDLVSALKVTLRRWKIAATVLVVTTLAAVAAFFTADTVYSAENYVVVVPNSVTDLPNLGEGGQVSQVDQAQRSALVSAGGARLISNLLVTSLNSAERQAQLGVSPEASYQASADPQLPVVTIAASGTDETAVATLLGRVIDGSDGALANLQAQAGIPQSTAYRAPRFAPDPIVTSATPDRNRVVGAILVAGIALAVLLAVALDGPLTRRERARQGAGADDGDGAQDGAQGVDGAREPQPVQPQPVSRPQPTPQPVSRPQPTSRTPGARPTPGLDARTERLPGPARSVNADR
ncbi:hypothetical protein WHI96_17695 [Pseudonocardia tropica]|uniref:Capsular polysaccharide biosynthesis protein n=2 Tax=Pseudonocardia tropica TaxID=681289 RepID=A0ABV1JXG7_9PSEU